MFIKEIEVIKKTVPIILKDTIFFPPCEEIKSTNLFIDREQNSKSIVEISENKIVKYIMENDSLNNLLCNNLGFVGEVFYGLELSKPIKKHGINKPGDFDVIIFEKNKLNLAVSIQVKCIGLIIKNNLNKTQPYFDFINHKDEVEDRLFDGIKQTYLQSKHYQFHRNYFMIILEIDARQQKDVSILFRDINDNTYKLIRKFLNEIEDSISEYDKSIGIILIPYIQNNDMDFRLASKVLVEVDRKSSEQIQPSDTTNRLNQALKSNLFKTIYVIPLVPDKMVNKI